MPAKETGPSPGPWKVDKRDGAFIVRDGRDFILASYFTETDAKIIASALEAQSLIKELIHIDGFISMHEMFKKDWEALVAKARALVVS